LGGREIVGGKNPFKKRNGRGDHSDSHGKFVVEKGKNEGKGGRVYQL